MLGNAKLQQSRLLPENHFPFIPADHSGDSEQVHYQVTVKTNLINRWTEFNPALQCVAALEQSGTASIMGGTTVSFYLSLLGLKYLLLLWLHSLKQVKGFYIHSKVFLSNFSCFKYFSYDVLFNLFQVIWIWLVKNKSSRQRTIPGLPLLLISSSWEYLMFLNTFVQKHINSKYYIMYCSCVIFFPVVCWAKCYQWHTSFIIHAINWYSRQICKLVHLY